MPADLPRYTAGRTLHAVCCALTVVLGSVEAGAQQKSEPEAVELPPVQVEGQRESGAPAGARPDTRLRDDELRQKKAGTLGATLQDELGVANSSFGPSVGLPVIRGLTGPRVRILVDGIGAHDASSTSPDHAIALDPMLADEIRLLRGPNTVRYGGSAIGGAVEVIDRRIPERIPKQSPAGSVEVRAGSNGDERAQGFKLDVGAGMFALHVDGVHRERGNVKIPGLAIDDAAIRRQFGVNNQQNTNGFVPNTNSRSHAMSIGGSLVGERGFIGIAVNDLVNNYGIPPAGHTHSDLPGQPPATDAPRIDMKQRRHDLKGELLFDDGPVEKLALRIGRIDYEHAEVDNNVVQTLFRNEVLESRFEIEHSIGKRLSGTIGLTATDRRFSALGLEAFVPESIIRTGAGFLVQRLDLDPVSFEVGLRRERQATRPKPQRTVFGTTVVLPEVVHGGESFSAAGTLKLPRSSAITLTYSRAKRSPDVQELYALGPHIATRTFDIGNARLTNELMEGGDLGISTDSGWMAGKLNVFQYRAKNYIHQRNAGLFYDPDVRRFRVRCVRLDECLPVMRYEQANAAFSGFEAQLVLRVADTPLGLIEVKLFTDYLRAQFTDSTDVPRIPPRRYGFEVAHVGEQWTASVRHTRARPQQRPGVNETDTAGYEITNAAVEYRWKKGRFETVAFVQGRNLLDREIRNATSFLRNFTPEPGRTLEAGVRTTF
jgi:iron complex outermembrane receptor protein